MHRDAEEVDLDDYYENQFETWVLNGDIHLMPRFTRTQVVYFKKDMFDEKGIEYLPQEWGAWNWEDYTNLLRQFADATAQPQLWGTSNYGLNANWLSQYWIRGWGANMVNPEDNTHCSLDNPKAIESLEWMRSIIIHDEPLFAFGADSAWVSLNSSWSSASHFDGNRPLESGRAGRRRYFPLGRSPHARWSCRTHDPSIRGRHNDLERHRTTRMSPGNF